MNSIEITVIVAHCLNTNTLNWIGMESNEEYAEIVKEGGDTVRIVKPYADHDKIMGELKQAEDGIRDCVK